MLPCHRRMNVLLIELNEPFLIRFDIQEFKKQQHSNDGYPHPHHIRCTEKQLTVPVRCILA